MGTVFMGNEKMKDDVIYRQDAIDALEREKTYSTAYKNGYAQTDYFKQYNMGLTDGIKALYKLPSVDAVEVVRCKDCAKCQVDTIFNQYWCGGERVLPNGFCNFGRRKDG